ncbi:unnamed protein product [Coregonus sp. 'balchen']|nr:unnamed protein product [Coregonus sp. 'balchen']
MKLIQWLCEQHPLLMYLFLASGGCVLVVVTMGVYSLLLLVSTVIFILLVCSLRPGNVHPMGLWTADGLENLLAPAHTASPISVLLDAAHPESNLHVNGPTGPTGRVTLITQSQCRGRVFLPLISYALNFTVLLGGPLSSFDQFVCFVEQITISPPPQPLGVISYNTFQARSYLTRLLRDNASSLSVSNSNNVLTDVLWIWGLAVVLRIRYYSHWRISLNNAAGLGFRAKLEQPV